MVRKPDGSVRVCIDYRAINERTVRDSFPLPRIDDLIDKLRDARCITHLDLRSAYNQVRMSDDGPSDDSIAATAFQGLTPNGAPCLLEMLVMGFGLCNAPATFTRLMTHVLDPYIHLFVIVYLDDICIYSKNKEEHLEHLRKVLTKLREFKLFIKMPKCFWAKIETEYLGFIVGSGNVRTSPSKLSAVKDWPLPETQKQVKSFVAFCSFYRKFIHHFADCSAPLTDLCRKSLPGKVAHSDATRAAFETLKARMISAPVLLIPKSGQDADFVVATDASKVGIAGVLLQEDSDGHLRPCAYWARKLKDAETRYSAYDREALAIVEAVSRVWRTYLLGSKCFSVVTDHATLVHLLKQSSEKLTDRQTHWVEKLMPYANIMRILYRKGSLNEADPVSRRPDFHPIDDDKLYNTQECLWWDGKVLNAMRSDNEPALLALSTEELNVDADFLTQLKEAYSSCNYFSLENSLRWKSQNIVKSTDGLFRKHNRVVIPRPAKALRESLLLEYHDNAGHSNHRRVLATLLKRYWWDKIAFDCKAYCQNCIVCNRAKPDRRGASSLHPLGVPEYPWEIVGIDYVTDLPKSGSKLYTSVFIMVCHLTKMAHFVPCHKDITAEESSELFIDNCYRLHGVPKVIVSDRDPKFVGKFWQSFMRKLNTKLNMSTARHPRTDGLTERVNESMQTLLRCYCAESGSDWASQLSMVEFYYNCSTNEAARHSPFEVMYGFQPSTPADRLLPLTGATADAADRLTNIVEIRDVVKQLLILSKERMAARTTRSPPNFSVGDLVYLSTRGLHIRSQKCKHLRDQKLGPYKVLAKVGMTSYKLMLPDGCRLHPVFHRDLLSQSTTTTSLRPHQAEIEGDMEEYAINYIDDVKLDTWPRRRGLYLQFLTYFINFDTPEWMLLEQVDDCEELSKFLSSEKWTNFSLGKVYLDFVSKYPKRIVILDK